MWPFKKKEIYFKAGDIIKCIDDRNWNDCKQTMSLIFGKTYKVLQVIKCPTCGCVTYDVGCRFNDTNNFTKCSKSEGGHEIPGIGIHVAGHFRFEKSTETESEQSAEQIQEEINECILQEDFEKSGKLKKKLEAVI